MFVLKVVNSATSSNSSKTHQTSRPLFRTNQSYLLNLLRTCKSYLEQIRNSNEQKTLGGNATKSYGQSTDSSGGNASVNGNLPFYKQTGDPDISDAKNANCGPTALLMAAEALGVKTGNGNVDTKIEQMRQVMGANPNEGSVTFLDQLANGARNLGLNAETADNASVGDIANEIRKGNKTIVHVNPKGYGGPDIMHFIVVKSIQGDPNDPNSKVTIHDPLRDEPITITVGELQQSMTGNVVSISK